MRTLFVLGRIPARNRHRPSTRAPFVVGRAGSSRRGDAGTREYQFPRGRPSPLPGPWSLRALVVSGSTPT